jgi:hypothetical protein
MDNIQAINNFFYWIHNHQWLPGRETDPNDNRYYPDVVMKADWTCDREHMQDKWWIPECSCDAERTMAFYANLDADNRRIMLEWICNNYDCGISI